MAAGENTRYPLVNLNNLEDPPQDWLQVRNRENTLKKRFCLNELRALLEYHAYGFQCMKNFGRKQDCLEILHKVLYYTQNGLGNNAAFTEEGIVCAGSVGPGTLSVDLRTTRGLPAWYLTEHAALEKIQPHRAVRFAHFDRRDRPRAKAVCYKISSRTPLYSEASMAADDASASAQNALLPKDFTLAENSPATGKLAEAESVSKISATNPVIALSDDGKEARVVPASVDTTAGRNEVQKRHWRMTRELVREAVMASAYSGLQTVPDLSLHAEPFLVATRPADLWSRLTENQIATSKVTIRFTDNARYAVDKDGSRHRYYGRGPEWHDNSCYWDCIIVSCIFLNAGFTYLDRGDFPESWENKLTTIQRAFLDATRMDWSFFDKPTSVAQRNMFLTRFYSERKDEGIESKSRQKGEMDSPAARWNDIAGPFKQFSFQAHQRRQTCPCQKRGPHNNTTAEVGYVTPPYLPSDAEGVSLTGLLGRWSRFVLPHCPSGAKETRNIIHGNLPFRMVVQITTGTKLLDHTSQNITFSYSRIEPESGEETAERITYRWLGGVYCCSGHFRIYWNDSKPDAPGVDLLRVYDGMEAAGAIIGDVIPSSLSEPIPDNWMKDCPPLLFYEQVINPSSLVLEAARSVITDMFANQQDRSGFPQLFWPASLGGTEHNLETDALLPRQLPDAVLRVEGPLPDSTTAPADRP